MIEFSDKSRKW